MKKITNFLEFLASKAISWVGSVTSIVVHTILFAFAFVLYFLGVHIDKILLVVTTIVSLEAIYLAIFIQMSVNQQGKNLKEVAEDIDEIQEDVEEIEKDIDEIQEDVEEIEKEEELDTSDESLERIQNILSQLTKEVEELKKRQENIQK